MLKKNTPEYRNS